jgi:hypothetical protein
MPGTARLTYYESRLELSRILLADLHPDVVEIVAQLFQLTGCDGEVRRRHVPDLLLQRWVAAYRRDGEAGLVDSRIVRGRCSGVDARWDDALRLVLAEWVRALTPTRSAVLAGVD